MNQVTSELYPLLLKPVYKDYLWGGERISQVFRRDLPPGVYAESWEVSDRPEGQSIVAEGKLSGHPLGDIVRSYGKALLGSDVASARFPWLIKLIDARTNLSVQVHPDDRTAREVGGEAKTEAWYVLADTPGAAVYAGFKPGVDEPTFRRALAANTVEELLEKILVKSGDLVYVPGGLAHAIGAGCLLLETQQNSNTTYRVYDWGRVGNDGQPRELHVEKAVQVMDWPARPQIIRADSSKNTDWETLIRTPYFSIARLRSIPDIAPVNVPATGGPQVLFVASGTAVLTAPDGYEQKISAGVTALIPAILPKCHLSSQGISAEIIRVF